MGRGTKKGSRLDPDVDNLFAEKEIYSEEPESNLPVDIPALRLALSQSAPPQTDAKSRLISTYLSLFQRVTGGGLYIDGFAAPQSRDHPDAWTAKRVLDIKPPRLRTFWLCDLDRRGIEMLHDLKKQHHRHPPVRRVFVFEGDFNVRVHDILQSGRIHRRTAVFALLDQRMAECHWSTVKALADYKGATRIELLYFLATGWIHRSLTQSRTAQRHLELDRWWGGPGWRTLSDLTQLQISEVVSQRFQRELGYRFSTLYPIFLRERGEKKAFTLIHASDHSEAPKLMKRAFYQIYGDRKGTPTDSQKSFGWGPEP